MTAPVTRADAGPVQLGAVLNGTALPDRWLLVGSAGLWCGECLMPGCGWTTTTGTCEAAITATTVHALTHPATTSTAGRTADDTTGRTA